MSSNNANEFADALIRDALAYAINIRDSDVPRLVRYYELLSSWNDRLHLVAPVAPSEFATRHVLESLMLAKYLPANARVADIGSGGGLPIIPCLISRNDIAAKLIEASKKKSVFLRETINETGIGKRATVVAERFEDLPTPEVDCVTSRALEKFTAILPQLIDWTPDDATLFLFGGIELENALKTLGLQVEAIHIPNSERRFLLIARKRKP